MERAGFMDAPQTGPATKASRNTVPPMITPAGNPSSLDPWDTRRITPISSKLSNSSRKKLVAAPPAGWVDPRNRLSGKRI